MSERAFPLQPAVASDIACCVMSAVDVFFDLREEEIERIKLSFPYDRKELLEDKEQTAAWTDELNALIAEYKEIYTAYEQKLQEILR